MSEPTDPSASHRWRWQDLAALAVVMLVAAVVRFAPFSLLQSESRVGTTLSMDELWHLGLSTGRHSLMDATDRGAVKLAAADETSMDGAEPIYRVWTGMNGPGMLHPPLYVATLRVWRDVFGGTDVAAQLYSELWAFIAIVFGFAAVRLCFDRYLAALSMLLLAVAPVQVYFAQEVRSYAMVSGLAAMVIWCMARIEVLGPKTRRGVVLGLLPLPLLLTHYFSFGACLAVGVYALLRFRGRQLAATLTAIGAGAVIYAVVWLPFAVGQLGQLGAGDEFLRADDLSFWDRSLSQALSMPFQLLVNRPFSREPMAVFAAVAYVLPILWWRRAPRLQPWFLVGAGVVLPLLLLDALRSTTHLQFIRYVAAASMALPPLLVLCVAAINRRLALAVCPLMVAGIALFLHAPMDADSPKFGGLTRQVAERLQPGEPVLFVSVGPPTWIADGLAMQLLHEPRVAPRTILKLDQPATLEQLADLAGASSPSASRTIWIVTATPSAPLEKLAATDQLLVRESVGHPFEGVAVRVELPVQTISIPSVPPTEASTVPAAASAPSATTAPSVAP